MAGPDGLEALKRSSVPSSRATDAFPLQPSMAFQTPTAASKPSRTTGVVRPDPKRAISDLICGNTSREAFSDIEGITFTEASRVDIFEVNSAGTTLRGVLDDGEVRDSLKADRQRQDGTRLRFYFIDGVEKEFNRLAVTSTLLSDIFDQYSISSRFADFLTRQHMPGRAIHHEPQRQTPLTHEMWYSAVLRSHMLYQGKFHDLTRDVIDWQRFCLWSSYHVNGNSTHLIWRCPTYVKEIFFRTFEGERGVKLRHHPMLAHSFFAEHICQQTYDFLKNFAEPLYSWETKVEQLRTTSDYTARSKAFLALARQIHQVGTDYDILRESIEHLQRQNFWFREHFMAVHTNIPFAGEMMQIQGILEDEFDTLIKEVQLLGTYSNLYLERSKIGVNECFAMVNQRDAEINIKMAAESTTIARASHQDNRSLRIIQIMTMVFLPASFVSGVFGMGFFNTSIDQTGETVFTISGNWWLYLAVALPLTLAILLVIGLYQARDNLGFTRAENRDMEAQMPEKED